MGRKNTSLDFCHCHNSMTLTYWAHMSKIGYGFLIFLSFSPVLSTKFPTWSAFTSLFFVFCLFFFFVGCGPPFLNMTTPQKLTSYEVEFTKFGSLRYSAIRPMIWQLQESKEACFCGTHMDHLYHNRASLVIKWKETDINITGCHENTPGFPVHLTIMVQRHSYLLEVWCQLISPANVGEMKNKVQIAWQSFHVNVRNLFAYYVCLYVKKKMAHDFPFIKRNHYYISTQFFGFSFES